MIALRKAVPFLFPLLWAGLVRANEGFQPMREAAKKGRVKIQLEKAATPPGPSTPTPSKGSGGSSEGETDEEAKDAADKRIGEGGGYKEPAVVVVPTSPDKEGTKDDGGAGDEDEERAFPKLRPPGRKVAAGEPPVPGGDFEEDESGDDLGEDESPFEPGDEEALPEKENPLTGILTGSLKKVAVGALAGGLIGLAMGAPWVGAIAGGVVALGIVIWGLVDMFKNLTG